jgi:hypothetical protein
MVVRKGLARADYNLNHKKNMVILPMDSKVAGALNLPRHLMHLLAQDHAAYSNQVLARLKGIMKKYEQQLSNYLDNKDKEHVKLNHKLAKESIENLSQFLFALITARVPKDMKKADFNGTLDTTV